MTTDSTTHKYSNRLIHESSPYLLQHAHNPVDWYPWGEEAFEQAKKSNKLVLVSIGYSACHWCHVMEHESFENDSVARIMNEHFICIKVDREERPDIDQVYMNAVQLMTGSGGWPLNCFVLPDGRPVYGGTYFNKQQWVNILMSLSETYKKDSLKVIQYADELTEGVRKSELVKLNTEKPDFTIDVLKLSCANWSKRFDNREGGPDKAPKFPLPNNYQFLLQYAKLTKDEALLKHVDLTLEKMAFGGIYDQIGGGFARYSTDSLWKAPHFEKMLYDNAQLVSLYAEAFRAERNPLYKEVVQETLEYIKREMTGPQGEFYSALDADSEGEEGKYYVWKKEELEQILGTKFDLFAEYFNVNSIGYWEHNNYILLRKKTDKEIADQFKISLHELQNQVREMKKQVLAVREKRIKPGRDDKSLSSWNALMIKGYVDAYSVFNEPEYLNAALKNADFIAVTQRRTDGGLFHNYKKGKTSINAYLEDYAFSIEAFIALYEVTFDEKWLNTARDLMDYSITHFHDKDSAMFYFTSDLDKPLISRKMEISDNVIPASNSSIANSLFLLSHYYDRKDYLQLASQMLNNVKKDIPGYGAGYSNWMQLMIRFTTPFYEIAMVGKQAQEKRKELDQYYLPNKIILGSQHPSMLPLLQNKYSEGKTLIYVCENKTCKLPVGEIKEVLKQIPLIK